MRSVLVLRIRFREFGKWVRILILVMKKESGGVVGGRGKRWVDEREVGIGGKRGWGLGLEWGIGRREEGWRFG